MSSFNLQLSVFLCLLLPEEFYVVIYTKAVINKVQKCIMKLRFVKNITEFGSWDLSGKLSGNDFSDFQLFM